MNNFDLKKFLIENKLTTNSRLNEEDKSTVIANQAVKLAQRIFDSYAEDKVDSYWQMISWGEFEEFFDMSLDPYIDADGGYTQELYDWLESYAQDAVWDQVGGPAWGEYVEDIYDIFIDDYPELQAYLESTFEKEDDAIDFIANAIYPDNSSLKNIKV